jgi:hypothetical protein
VIIALTTLAVYAHPGIRHLETTLPEYPAGPDDH